MAKNNALLLEYLEGVSWRILEEYLEEYPDAVRELIRRRAGVYALYRGRKLYYVGLAKNLMGESRTTSRTAITARVKLPEFSQRSLGCDRGE